MADANDKTDALLARLRMHARDCVSAADMDTDTVLSAAQIDDMADALNEAAEALAEQPAGDAHYVAEGRGYWQIAVEGKPYNFRNPPGFKLVPDTAPPAPSADNRPFGALTDLYNSDSAGGAKCGVPVGYTTDADGSIVPGSAYDDDERNTPQPAEGDGAVGYLNISEASEGDGWQDCVTMTAAGRALPVGRHAIYTRPAATAVVPDGFVLVPRIMHLDADTLQAASFIFGGEDGEFCDTVLSVGITTDDDGKETYGLFCYSADYPEEGTIPLLDFAAPAAPKGDPLVLPAGWYTFVHDCAQAAGGMVNGNRLSAKAKALIDDLATARAEQGGQEVGK